MNDINEALEPDRVAVIRGGSSEEREISMKSGKAVVEALQPMSCKVLEYDTHRDIGERLRADEVDAAFIALHGRGGEDGSVQSILDWYDIPYTGPGPQASAICMDKLRTKQILDRSGLPTPEWKVIRAGDSVDNQVTKDRIVVKPRREGSSIGMSIVSGDEHDEAVEQARQYGDDVILENYVSGYEVTVGVVEFDHVRVLPPVGICPSHDYFDYETKYTKGLTQYDVPAECEDNITEQLTQLAREVAMEFETEALCRVDFILANGQQPQILEVNTIPGLTETSLLPKSAAEVGMPFEQLVKSIVNHAWSGHSWPVE